MIRWGVENELHTFLGQAQLGAMCTLFNSDYIVCSSKKTMFISSNKISKTSSNVYTTIIFAEYLDMVFGVDVGFCRLSAFQPRNPTDFYVKDFPLGQQWVHQLYYDKTHNFLITVGNDIKIWKISRNQFVSCPEERFLLELQSTIPSTSFVCDLNEIYVDEARSRIIVPSSHGLIVYHYDGQVAANNSNMCLDKFSSVCLRIAPVKHERMKEKFKKEMNVVPLNLYKRFFGADTEGNLLLWHRCGQLLHRFDERIQSILFAKFISAEFVILVDKMSKIYIMDVKSFHIVVVDETIQKKPDRIYLLRHPDRLAIASVNEIFIFRINTLWTLWYHPISTAFSLHRYTSPNIMTRFGFFSDDGFFRLISPKGRYLIASAAVKKCAMPRYVAYDPTCDDDLCIMALDDSTIQFFKITDENSDQILTENEDKYENKDKKPSLLGKPKTESNENEENKGQTEETKKDEENDIKNNNNNETKKNNEENKEDDDKKDENEKYEVDEADQLRRLMMNDDRKDKVIKETDDFHIVDYIKSSSQILIMAKVFAEKEWALISLGPQGDLNVFEWGTWERKKRLFFDHSKPKFAFWDRINNTLIIISQKKLAIISLETFIFNYNEFFKEPHQAAYENGLLITYSKDGKTCYYEVTSRTVKKIADLNILDKVVSITLQYGIHIFVFDNSSISIGDRSNFSIVTIQLPFQPQAVSFTNAMTMDLLIAIHNEVMILPITRYYPEIEAYFCPIDDYDGEKIDPRVFIKSKKHSRGNGKYADASTGTGDADEDNDNSSDIGDYDDINSDSDDDDFTDDEEYNKKRRIKRYKKQLKRGIFKTRDFKTVTKPFFDAEADFEENFDYKSASIQLPPPRQIKTISSMVQPPKDNKDDQPKPREPVYIIAGKIKSGQKASVYRFKRSNLNGEEEEMEEEEEEADENGDRIKGMFDLLEIKELTFDKETQTDETFVSKMKEREAEERRKQLLAKIAEMNKKNKRKKKGKGDGEGGSDSEGNGTTDNETGSEFDSEDSRYGRGKGKKGKNGKNGKKGGKGDGESTDGTGTDNKSRRSRLSSTNSKLSSLSRNNGKNGRNNRNNRDKNGSKSDRSKTGANGINSSLSSQNLPGDLYFNSNADAVGNQKNVSHPDGYDGSGGKTRRGGKYGKGGGYGDGSSDFSKTPRRGKGGNGYGYGYGYGGYGKGGPGGYGSGYGADGMGGEEGSNSLLDGYDKYGNGFPSKIYRRIDYDDAAIFDRLNGHSPGCRCECCDPNYKRKDVHLPSYRLIEGQDPCGCGHDHKHGHEVEGSHKKGNSYIYGNEPYIGITIENFPSDTKFKDQTILCGYDNISPEELKKLREKDKEEDDSLLVPVVPPKTPKKKKKMPIVIPPDRLSFSSRRPRPPPISTASQSATAGSQARPNSCRTSQFGGPSVLITQQEGGEAFESDNESEVAKRPQSSRTILATPEKEALWQKPQTAYNDNSGFPQFRFAESAKSNYSTPNSARSNQLPLSTSSSSSASSSARHSARMSLHDSYVLEFENSSTSPRNLSRPVLHDEGYSGYGTGFGYEFAQKAPDFRNTTSGRVYVHNTTPTRRSGEVLPPLPKVV